MDSNTTKSFWDLKPFWCQPWSIISFGISALILSWILFHNIIVSLILGLFIIAWWIVFLILAPNSYQVMNDKK